jgi:hypothetical protein
MRQIARDLGGGVEAQGVGADEIFARLVELLLELFDRPRGDVKRLLELIKERFLLVRLLGGKDV